MSGPNQVLQETNGFLHTAEKAIFSGKNNEAIETQIKAAVVDNEKFLNEWYEKLKTIPYFDGSVLNIPGLMEQKNIYYNAFETLREYDSLHYSGKKSLLFESIEADLRFRIRNFQENFNRSAKALSNEVKHLIIDKIEFLKMDTILQTDSNKTPNFIDKLDIDEIRNQMEKLKPLYDSASISQELLNLFSQLMDLNETHKNAYQKKI